MADMTLEASCANFAQVQFKLVGIALMLAPSFLNL